MSREMKNSGVPWIGEIPKAWKVLRTKNVFSIGKDIVGEQSSHTQLLSLTTKGIKAIPIGSTSGKVPDSYDTYQVVHKNDLVMCLFDLDCSAVFSGLSSIEGMISPAYKVLSLQSGFSPRFYDYWYAYIFDGRKYKFLSKNIRYSLTYDEFAALGIVAPSFSEQEAIADFLDHKCGEIDEMISLQEKIVEELKAYKQAVIVETITKGLNPNVEMKNSGIDWIGMVPKSWDIMTFRRLFAIRKIIAHEDGLDVLSVTQQGLKIKDLSSNEGQMADDYSNYQRVRPNDFVMNHMDLLTGWIDISSFYGVTSPDYRVFESLEDFPISRKYYLYVFQACYKGRIFYHLGQGVSGQGRWRLPAKQMLRFNLPYPKEEEQKAIVEYLDKKTSEIDSLIALKQNKITSLKEYKKSIIYEYVTGKKSVNA